MADIDQIATSPDGTPFTRRLEDQGDGSHAPGSVLYLRKPDGTYIEATGSDQGSLITSELGLEVSRGNIAGMKMFSIPGRRDAVNTTNLEDLTETGNDVLGRPAGATLDLISASGNDAVAGSGVQIVQIEYLDSAGAEQQLQVNTSGGTVADVGAGAIHDVQWIHAVQVGGGSLGIAAGNITLVAQSGGEVFEQITAGGNQSLSARYKVPTGKIGYIMGWQASAITRKIDIKLRADVDRFDRSLIAGVFTFQDVIVLEQAVSGWIPFWSPLKMPSGAVIKISGISFTGTGDLGGQFDILLIDD